MSVCRTFRVGPVVNHVYVSLGDQLETGRSLQILSTVTDGAKLPMTAGHD